MTGGRERKEETNDHYHHDIIVPGEQLTPQGDPAQPPAVLRPGAGQGSESDHDRSSDTDLSSRESGDQEQVTQAHDYAEADNYTFVFSPGAVKRS